LQARILGELQRRSGFDIRFTQTAVTFPATLEWRNVTFTNSEWGAVQFALLQAKIGVLKLLTGGFGLDVLMQTNETAPNAGVAKGTVTATSIGLEGRVSIKGQAQQVDLSTLMRRYVSRGILKLNGEFLQGLESRPGGSLGMKGDGVWKAEVHDLAIDQIPLSNGLTLSLGFTRVAAALSCRDAVCDVTELKGDGPDGSFTGGGKITVQQPIQNSQLTLSLTMVPGSGFASKGAALGIPPLPTGVPVTVKVLGTLAQARIAL
jgi:type II secretion system protein N